MLPNFKRSDPQSPAPQLPGRGAPPPPRPPARPGEPRTVSVIGPDLLLTGNLVSNGEVQIDGEVQGDVHGSHVLIGSNARITGSVIGEEVILRGHVMGSVRGQNVMLQATSRVEGDIYHKNLSIEQGAYFEGKSSRSEDPTAGVQHTNPHNQDPIIPNP